MSEPTGDCSETKAFATVDLETADVDLSRLHAQVLGRWGRVELARRGGTCVLISKDELESLEKALEILSNTDTVRLMRQEIALVARVATPHSPLPTTPDFNGRSKSLNLP